MKNTLILILVLCLVLGILIFAAVSNPVKKDQQNSNTQPVQNARITNFEECMSAGNPVMESYPRQCKSGDTTFVEEIGNELEKSELIRVDSPKPNQLVSSPLEVTGEARGTWYFEADFPVYLYDSEGNELARSPAQAQGAWMTEEFVPFVSTLTFATPATDTGELVLKKNNPSDLPENADELRIPVRFR